MSGLDFSKIDTSLAALGELDPGPFAGGLSAIGLPPGPSTEYVTFDSPENPTARDLATVTLPGVRDSFEVRDGKIVPKFVPIRERVGAPAGRTDYGWDHEVRRRHLTSAYARGWKEFPYRFKPHDGVLHIVGGGPSLRKCIKELRRYSEKKKHFVLTLNKSHDFLLNLPKHKLGPPIKVWGAALLDPCDWVKDYITPRKGVQYFIGDQCAPATFDVFEKPELTKWIYRATNPQKDQDVVPQTMTFVFGGSTVGLRMRTMGAMMGFREIHYWGFDSSCDTSEDKNGKLHAYEKADSVKDRIFIKIKSEDGESEETFTSNTHMARQAQEYIELRDQMIANFKAGRSDWLRDIFHGEGLLPAIARNLGIHADCLHTKNPITIVPGSPIFAKAPGVAVMREHTGVSNGSR